MVQQPVYDWDVAETGDASPPHVVQATPDFIAEFCRVARYENPVYTSQAAARESGMPAGVAPPAMVLALAPINPTAVAAARGCVLPVEMGAVEIGTAATGSGKLAISPSKISITFQGALVAPGDEVTSVTTTQSKSQDRDGFYIIFRVSAHNQKGEPVVDYSQTFSWPEPGSSHPPEVQVEP